MKLGFLCGAAVAVVSPLPFFSLTTESLDAASKEPRKDSSSASKDLGKL